MKFCTTLKATPCCVLFVKIEVCYCQCVFLPPEEGQDSGIHFSFFFLFFFEKYPHGHSFLKKFQATECDLHNFSSSFGFDEEIKEKDIQILHTYIPPNRPLFILLRIYDDFHADRERVNEAFFALHFVLREAQLLFRKKRKKRKPRQSDCVQRFVFLSRLFYQCKVKELS